MPTKLTSKHHWPVRYGGALAAMGAGLLLRLALTAWVGPGLPTYLTFFPAVMAVALLGGLGPGLLATVASVLVVDYWVVTPGGFGTESLAEAVGMGLFSLMGVFMSFAFDRYHRARLKAAAYDQELALRESEQQFRTLADSIPNLAWWANGDGYITWYNRRWYEYTGTTPQQMEGWGWQIVHDPKMLPN